LVILGSNIESHYSSFNYGDLVLEHLSEQMIERYRRRSLPADELFAVDDHLSSCETCRVRAVPLEQPERAFTALRTSLTAADSAAAHLSYEQIASFVDDDLDDVQKEVVATHLDLCAACDGEVQDLRAFKSEVEAMDHRVPVLLEQPTLWQRLSPFGSNYHWAWSTAVATLAILLIAVPVLVYFKQKPTQNFAESARTTPQPTNQSSPVVTPSVSQPETDVALEMNDGSRRVTLNKQGKLSGLEALPPSSQRAVSAALVNGRIDTPSSLAAISAKRGTLMGGAEGVAFQLTSPVGEIIREDRPTFRWKQLSGVRTYTVSLLDSNYNVVATSPLLTATEWKPSRPLPRGVVYSWQVTAHKDPQEITAPAPPAPEAKFKVLDGAQFSEIRRAEAAYPDSHLTRGVLYAEAGLLEEAEREFHLLSKSNPNSAPARKLLQQVRALRRSR
jgi:hypothetical protein